MVLLDRALVSSYRLSIVTMSLTAAVWPQFATTNFDWSKSVTKLANISGLTVPN